MKYSEAFTKSKQSYQTKKTCKCISNYEMETFTTFLRAVGADDAIEYEVTHSGFQNLMSDVYQLSADQHYNFMVLLLLIEDIFPELSYRTTAAWSLTSIQNIVSTAEERIVDFVQILQSNVEDLHCKIVVIVLPVSPPPIFATNSLLFSQADRLYFLLQAKLLAVSYKQQNISVLDSLHIFRGIADRQLRNMKLFFEAGIPLSLESMYLMAQAIHSWHTHRCETRKLLITDLDQTLWSGVIGDGVSAVSALPEANTYHHYIYQGFLQLLRTEGVIIAACSKNTLPDVTMLFENEDCCAQAGVRMTLSDFASFSCSWEPKSLQIKQICENLNILPSSAVFIDDNPLELFDVSQALPELACIQFPQPKDFHAFLMMVRSYFFSSHALTNEDIHRTAYYEIKQKAEESKSRFDSYEEFLRSLTMALHIAIVHDPEEERSFQLYNKTNQFNLTGLRLSKQDWKQYFLQPDAYCISGTLHDRFGAHGLILVALIRYQNETIWIDNMVLSCRVFNRSIETAFLDWLTQQFRGITTIQGKFCPTGKNEPCQQYFSQHRFQLEVQSEHQQLYVTNDLAFSNHTIKLVSEYHCAQA